MTGRFKKSVVMALVAAMCFTQNTGMIRAAEAPEKIGGVEAGTPGYAEPETGSVSKSDIESDIESEIISENIVENNSKENRTEDSAESVDNTDLARGKDGDMPITEEAFVNAIGVPEVSLVSQNYLASDLQISYHYDFGAPLIIERAPYRWNVIFTDGNSNIDFNDGKITREDIETKGWEWEELASVYKPGGRFSGNDDPRYISGDITIDDGIFFAGKKIVDKWEWENSIYRGLKPNKTYRYYLAIASDEQYPSDYFYVKTEEKTFTTKAGHSSSGISLKNGDSITVEHNYEENCYQVSGIKLNNPDNEFVVGFFLGKKDQTYLTEEELISEYGADLLSVIWEPQDTSEDREYECLFNDLINTNTETILYAVVYTGTVGNPEFSLVKLKDLEFYPSKITPISSDNISVEYVPGLSTIEAKIKYLCDENPYLDEEYQTELSKYFRNIAVEIGLSGGTQSNTYTSEEIVWYVEDDQIDSDDDDFNIYYTGHITLNGFGGHHHESEFINIVPNTEYTLRASIGIYDIINEEYNKKFDLENKTVTTKPDEQVNKSEFDEAFLTFLKNDCGLEYSGGATVSQSSLDRITDITTWAFATPIANLKGIKHLRNLKSIEINDNSLTDISDIADNDKIESVEFMENKIASLPDLSEMNLGRINLDWNYIPDSEVLPEKLPFDYLYLEDVIKNLKETQHRYNDFGISKLYVKDDFSGGYPFEFSVDRGKLKAFNSEKLYKDKGKSQKNLASFYILKTYLGDTDKKSNDTVDGSISRIGVFYDHHSQDNIQEMKELFGLNEVYYDSDWPDQYDFKIQSVSGIDAPGEYPVTWKLIKRDVRWKDGNPEYRDIEVFTHTEEVLYTSGEVTSVKVSPGVLELAVNGTSKLTATVTTVPDSLDKSVTWTTGDEKVATVDAQGNVTAVGPGTTTITAASKLDPNKKDTCSVTVKEAPPVVPVDPTGLLITTTDGKDTTFVGSKLTLKAEFLPTGATADAAKVKYETKDTKIVSLNGAELTGLAEGTAVIDGSYTVSEGSVLKAQFTVKVRRSGEEKKTFYKVTFLSGNTLLHTESVLEGQPALEPEIKPEQPDHMFIGWGMDDSAFDFTTPVYSDLTLKAIFRKNKVEVTENSGSGMDAQPDTDLKKEGNKVTGDIYLVKGQTYTSEDAGKGWSTDNTAVAKVAKNTGKITAAGEGDAKVSNETHELNVHVAAPDLVVTKVAGKASSVGPKKVSLLVGESAEYKLDKITKNAEKYPVTWYSSNTQVAVVTGGVVTAIGKGSANISAFTGGKEYKGKVTVTDSIKAPDKIGTEAEIDINAMKAVQLKFTSFKSNGSVWEAVGDSKKLEVVKSDRKGNPVLWRNDIIEITNKGKVTGIGEGSTKIKGTDTKGETVTVTVNVKVINTKTAAFVNKDKTATLKFPNVNNKNAEWFSSDPSKVSVDNDRTRGKIRGLAVGSSSVTCSVNNANGIVFETLVYCQEPQLKADPAGKLKIDAKGKGLKGSINLDAGEVYRIEISGITGMPDFKSGNKTAVFVDENGLIYARQKGKKSTINARINGTILKIAVTVNR